MRRVVLVAAFALVLAAPTAWGQMRGGMRAAPAAHFSGPVRAGGFSGGRVHFGVAPGFAHGGFHHPVGVHGCWNCFHSFSHRRFSPWCFTYGDPYYGYGYGYYGGSAYDASYYDSSSNDDYQNQRQVSDHLYQLSRELRDLRDELQSRAEQPAYTPPSVRAPGPSPETGGEAPKTSAKKESTRTDLATVLVFRDQRIQEVKNYAIMGKNLVVVANQRQRKIPLADLDLPATAKLNEERGVDFQIP